MQDVVTRCLGLVTQYNPLNTAPGALIQADNCVITRENIVENRRGYASYLTLSNSINQLLVYSNKIVAHNGSKLSYDNSGSPSNYTGTYAAPSGYKMRAVEAYSNSYITTDQGVQVLTDVAGTKARLAGAPRSLDPSYALNAAVTGFLASGSQCAYRVVIQRTDANSNVLFGYPSTRILVVNTAGTSKNVDLTLYLPTEVTASDVFQFYRTAQVAGTTDDLSADEMALVYQVSPSATDIANGYLTFTDSITDALRGASLYTSPSQEGIIGANDRPPLCKDLALFRNDYMIYANTSTKQRLYFTLVGATALSGKTLKIAGVTYNFGASEIVSGAGAPQALVGSTGIAAADIDSTARSLVRVMNRYSGNTGVYAYYLSGPSDLPGQIMLEERGIGGAAFSVQSSDSTIAGMFFPPPPVAPATNTQSTSTNQVQKNAIYWSKGKQPEAVPGANYAPVGASNKAILRIAPLRESLIIIKEEGVFRATGDQPPFVVTPLDLTVFCKAPDSVAVLANTVIMLSNQGVVQITDTGVQVISREIEPNIKPLFGFALLSTLACGASYESERMYLLSLPTSTVDTANTQTFIYNIFTRAWTRWTFGFNSAIVEPGADKLYFSKSGSTVFRERKDFSDTDYADPESAITISAIDSVKSQVTFTVSGTSPDVGWVISQGGTEIGIAVLQSTGASYIATMTDTIPSNWVTGAATIYPPVGMEVIWDTWCGGSINAGMLKQVPEFAILADNIPGNNSATTIIPTFKSNFDEAQEEVLIPLLGGGWGAAWGAIAWGGSGDPYGYRTFVPRNKQMCRTMNPGVKHKNARQKLPCAGYAVQFEVISERISR